MLTQCDHLYCCPVTLAGWSEVLSYDPFTCLTDATNNSVRWRLCIHVCSRGRGIEPHLVLGLSITFAAPDRLTERSIIQKYLQMHRARLRQVGAWPLSLSAFQCACGVNIYFTLIYTSKGEEKMLPWPLASVKSGKKEEGKTKKRKGRDLRDSSAYSIQNPFLFTRQKFTECEAASMFLIKNKGLHAWYI